ncbi:hypothetical protein HHK36_006249 [Tetracentron sinense]|uniref:RRM domain-containing protein n=1 Tax=Tetracentron sinense TaxID=13715 RepID=A0A834ZH47_TETSI|nr:hypothetical protein HHK36_006249 [Tetracentron sinense]
MAAMVGIPPHPTMVNASLYVGDLDPLVSEMELLEAFTGVSGPIASVRLCRDSASGKSLRYAYVNYFSPSDGNSSIFSLVSSFLGFFLVHGELGVSVFVNGEMASKALHSLNHTKLNGKPMRIMWCQRDPLPRKTGVANLFVKNIDLSVDSTGLRDIFCKFGTVLSCKVAEENGRSQGFGFVQFDSEESAMAALKALHGTMLQGKKLYVSKFVKKSDRQVCKESKFTNLYVKNLDQDLTEDILRDKFSEFGKVHNVVIMRDGEGKSRGFGFISFDSPEEAKKAVEAMNGAQLGSKNVFVGRAQKKDEREQLLKLQYKEMHDHKIDKLKASNVYVKNLDVSIDDEKLREHFSTCGQITSAKVMCHDNGKSKGFGFVNFSTHDEAKKALVTLHGTMFQGRSLYVAIAQRKEDRRIALQIHYARNPLGSLCPPVCEVVPTGIYPPYYYHLPPPSAITHINPLQPLMYEDYGTVMGALQPPKTQGYQTDFFTHGQMRNWPNELTFINDPVDSYSHHGVHPIDALQGIEQSQACGEDNRNAAEIEQL